MTSAAAGVVPASITTPGEWVELDLDPATRHRSIRRGVRAAVQRKTVRQADAVRLIQRFENIARRAHDDGAFYCASLVVDETARWPLVGNVTMHLGPYEDVPGRWVAPAQMCEILAEFLSRDADTQGLDVGVVALPFVGPAVRTSVVAGGSAVQYYVPVPPAEESPSSSDSGTWPSPVVLVTFTCPCPPYAAMMIELFDAMASSLQLHFE